MGFRGICELDYPSTSMTRQLCNDQSFRDRSEREPHSHNILTVIWNSRIRRGSYVVNKYNFVGFCSSLFQLRCNEWKLYKITIGLFWDRSLLRRSFWYINCIWLAKCEPINSNAYNLMCKWIWESVFGLTFLFCFALKKFWKIILQHLLCD